MCQKNISLWKIHLSRSLLLIWLLCTALGYWWYQGQHFRAFSQASAESIVSNHSAITRELEHSFKTLQSSLAATPSEIYLIHYSQPHCACSPASEAHLRVLAERYQSSGLQVIVADPASKISGPAINVASSRSLTPLWHQVKTIPSAAVFDGAGKLLYFGPYSSGPVCGSGINFVDQLLADLMKHQTVDARINDLAFGCFCETKNNSNKA